MKKVIYILNLLFLTLSVFGGSVFAADQYYFKGDGTVGIIPAGATTLPTTGANSLTADYYTINGTISGRYTIASGETVNIYVTGNVTGSGDNVWFCVPEKSTLNFYCGASSATATYDPKSAYTFSITNSQLFTIGNTSSSSWQSGGSAAGNFGTINFNSGNYTVINQAKTASAGMALGSPNTSGGSINIEQSANVTAYNYGGDGTLAVGVTEGNKCNITVDGGLLSSTVSTGVRTISVGVGGNFIVTGQGKVITTSNTNYNVPVLVEAGTWDVRSGIVGYYNQGGTTTSLWNAIVGGDVTLPGSQDLSVPTIGSYGSSSGGYWNSVTINPKATLTLGTPDPASTNGGYTSADFFLGGNDSFVDNYGEVIVNNVNQRTTVGPVYPASWNNNSGSTLTINSGAMLSVYDEGVENSDATTNPSQAAGEITVNGRLNLYNSAPLTNSGNLTVSQGGEITGQDGAGNVVGTGDVLNNQGGTVELDGTVILDDDSAISFQNSGTLDIGPIGQVVTTATQSNGAQTGGWLINNAGGTVTSQNPCYYGNQVYSGMSINPFRFNPM